MPHNGIQTKTKMNKICLFFIATLFSLAGLSQSVLIAENGGFSGNIVVGQSNYHVSESIYTNTEIGPGNFVTPGSEIQQIFFFLNTEGINTAISNYRVYMRNVPAATTTFTTGAYSTVGYTLVFNGVYNATPIGFTAINLTTPFLRTAGTNLQILIERVDNVLHTGANYDISAGNNNDPLAFSSRRYNGATLPVSGVTSLTATEFRPAILLNHTFPVDANLFDIEIPNISCYDAPQTVGVEVLNAGTTNILPGAASVTLRVAGANTFSGTLTNSTTILPGTTELINFSGVSFANAGINFDTAYVTLAGDGTTYNDTLDLQNERATTLSTFPLVEDAETTFPVFGYVQPIQLGQLWGIWVGDYVNADQTTPLPARAPGVTAYIFDSYSGDNSTGFESRLFSNCIDLTSVGSPTISFYMSHDNIFPTEFDSMYVSVSVDKAVTWTRLQGFRRPDPTALVPEWQLHNVSLAAYAGQTIQIAFEGVSKYGNAILVDDITISGVLPVSLLNFDAKRGQQGNQLTWRTAQELNSKTFVVERSADGGRSFATIGNVAAAGNSSTERSYQFLDASPVKGFNYYRLRVVDLDNSFKFSQIRNVRNAGNSALAIAPNPVTDNLKFIFESDKGGTGFTTITDLSGRQVYSGSMLVADGRNELKINTSRLSAGVYVFIIQINGEKVIQRFTKQ